jgi:hypothetical protein
MSEGNVRFCRQRAEKRGHCLELGLTHFVDDHPEVHEAIRGAVAHQYYFGPQSRPVPQPGQPTPTWADVENTIHACLLRPDRGRHEVGLLERWQPVVEGT